MDDNENKSSWDDLIEDLGAKPDETAYERKQPPPQEIPPSVDWSEEAEIPEPEAAAGDWNSLAESLGLEVEPEPAVEEPAADELGSADAAESPVEESQEPAAEVVASADSEAAEETAEETTEAAAGEDSFGGFLAPEEDAIDEQQDEGQGDEEAYAAEDDLPPLPSRMDQALSETAWDEDAESAETETATDDEVDGEGISGEAARSAFDALFSDGASSWGSAFLDKPKRDFSSPAEAGSGDDAGDASGSAELEMAANGENSGEIGGEDGDEEVRPKRKRSRRRRRGGRGRKPVGDQVAEDEDAASDKTEADETADGDAADELNDEVSTDEAPKKPRRRRSRRRSRSDSQARETETAKVDLDDDEGDLGLNDDEGQPRDASRGRQRHRNIPTWSEAIGMIVDANLEQRAKSPSKPQSSRGGRGGRGGRRRGGRKPEGKQ